MVLGEQGWRSGESARPPTNMSRVLFSDPASYVGRVCFLVSTLLLDIFLRVLRFSAFLENQHFQIKVRSWNAQTFLNGFLWTWVNKLFYFFVAAAQPSHLDLLKYFVICMIYELRSARVSTGVCETPNYHCRIIRLGKENSCWSRTNYYLRFKWIRMQIAAPQNGFQKLMEHSLRYKIILLVFLQM